MATVLGRRQSTCSRVEPTLTRSLNTAEHLPAQPCVCAVLRVAWMPNEVDLQVSDIKGERLARDAGMLFQVALDRCRHGKNRIGHSKNAWDRGEIRNDQTDIPRCIEASERLVDDADLVSGKTDKAMVGCNIVIIAQATCVFVRGRHDAFPTPGAQWFSH